MASAVGVGVGVWAASRNARAERDLWWVQQRRATYASLASASRALFGAATEDGDVEAAAARFSEILGEVDLYGSPSVATAAGGLLEWALLPSMIRAGLVTTDLPDDFVAAGLARRTALLAAARTDLGLPLAAQDR